MVTHDTKIPTARIKNVTMHRPKKSIFPPCKIGDLICSKTVNIFCCRRRFVGSPTEELRSKAHSNMEPSRLFVVPLTIVDLESPAEDSKTFRVKNAPRLDVNDGVSLQRLLEGRQTVADDTNKHIAKSWSKTSANLTSCRFSALGVWFVLLRCWHEASSPWRHFELGRKRVV